jgi:hypothetical protein
MGLVPGWHCDRAGDDAERSDGEERRDKDAATTMQSEAMRRSGAI